MDAAVLHRNRVARLAGMGFFLVLSGLFFLAELFYGHFSWHDLIPLAIVTLPLAINRRVIFLIFGTFTLLLSAYITLAVLIQAVGLWETLIPSVVAFLGVMASLLILYSCMSVSKTMFRFW